MTNLVDLAERVERASGADAELSKDIHEALGNCVHRETEYYCIEDGNNVDSGFTCKGCGKDTYGIGGVPDYTASLDAAMLLKPAGWRVADLFERNCSLPNWIWKAELWHPEPDQNVRGIARNADSPALALTAACLRARALSNTPSQEE